jgi:CDP-diacylglycerol--serine O-phosphatidyltransferase
MMGLLALTIVVSYLMISTIRYRSFKDLDLRRRRPAWILPLIAAIFVVIGFEPRIALLSIALAFAVSGPASKLLALLRRRPAEGTPASP